MSSQTLHNGTDAHSGSSSGTPATRKTYRNRRLPAAGTAGAKLNRQFRNGSPNLWPIPPAWTGFCRKRGRREEIADRPTQ